MSQQTWVYKNVENITYDVSLYHGSKSGHVLIFSKSDIIKIDFAVFKSKSFGFYLGEEWFELKINIDQSVTKYQLINVTKSKEIFLYGEPNFPIKHILKAISLVLGIAFLLWFAFLIMKR